MNQTFHKLLSIMLIFLLASLPLKLMAVEMLVNQNMPCHSIDSSQLKQMGIMHCDQCDDLSQCNNFNSSSLSFALIQVTSVLSEAHLSLSLQDHPQNTSLQTVTVLLRPPKI